MPSSEVLVKFPLYKGSVAGWSVTSSLPSCQLTFAHTEDTAMLSVTAASSVTTLPMR